MGAELASPNVGVGIVTNDREAAMAFWSGLFGFPVEGEVSFPGFTIVRLKAGDTIIRLCVADKPVEQQAHVGGFDAENGLRYVMLDVRNLDALVVAARAAGYPVPFDPREIRPGVRAVQIQDGHGVTVELMEAASA